MGKQWHILFSWIPKITANSDWSHEIKRFLLLERKAMTNLDSILKTRDTILLTKVHTVKAMVFSVVSNKCESLARKKAESGRTDAFESRYWRRLLRVFCKEIKPVHPKGSQSWIFTRKTDAEAEAPLFWSRNGKSHLTGNDAYAVKTEDGRRRGQQGTEMVG